VRNNPVRYTDPSGHWLFEDDPGAVRYIVPPKNPDTGQAVGVVYPGDLADAQPVSSGELVAAMTSPFWVSGSLLALSGAAESAYALAGSAYRQVGLRGWFWLEQAKWTISGWLIRQAGKYLGWTTNPLPESGRIVRVLPARYGELLAQGENITLSSSTNKDVFITAADEIAGLSTSEAIARRLTLVNSSRQFIVEPQAVVESGGGI